MLQQSVWGWEPALYIFLGGLGAGTFITATVLRFLHKEDNKLVICVSYWASVISIIFGLILLITDLVEPLRGLVMPAAFSHWTSVMTYGAWALLVVTFDFGICAVLTTLELWNPPWKFLKSKHGETLSERFDKPLRILGWIGIPFAIFIGFYTGLLLFGAPGIPFWHTIVLPFLFLISAVDTGVALVELISVILTKKDKITEASHKFLQKFTFVNIIIECCLIALFLCVVGIDTSTPEAMAGHASTMLLVGGDYAPFFWTIVIGIGLVLPFIMNLITIAIGRKKDSGELPTETADSRTNVFTFIGALGVELGGCALRFLVVFAGIHPDIVMEAFKALIH